MPAVLSRPWCPPIHKAPPGSGWPAPRLAAGAAGWFAGPAPRRLRRPAGPAGRRAAAASSPACFRAGPALLPCRLVLPLSAFAGPWRVAGHGPAVREIRLRGQSPTTRGLLPPVPPAKPGHASAPSLATGRPAAAGQPGMPVRRWWPASAQGGCTMRPASTPTRCGTPKRGRRCAASLLETATGTPGRACTPAGRASAADGPGVPCNPLAKAGTDDVGGELGRRGVVMGPSRAWGRPAGRQAGQCPCAWPLIPVEAERRYVRTKARFGERQEALPR